MADLYRAITPGLQIIERDDEAPQMVGTFTRYDQPTLIDNPFEGPAFIERTKLGAFRKSISESLSKIRVLFSHGKDPSLGIKPLGTIDVLEEQEAGPYFEVSLLRGLPVLLMEGLKAGIYGMSFHASVMQMKEDMNPERSDYNPDGLPERTYTELRLREFGPTPFPAIDGTQVTVRSDRGQILVAEIEQHPEEIRKLFDAGAVALGREEPSTDTPEDEPSRSTQDEADTREEDKPSWLL